ncbi:DUF58 domain-containing protein [Tepidiforma flava]|uniref:DUF58 domain-containing protein n=1 Tax=Tepidiforma flava TaxID=3004094 RepID=UPI004032EC36
MVTTPLLRRGLYEWGPLTVTAVDPFGIFRRTRTFGEAQQILVYPPVVELPHFQAPPANLPGEGRFRRRTHYVTPNAAGVREYAPGDAFNRIHWRSTARTGELMVKTFELDPASDIWVTPRPRTPPSTPAPATIPPRSTPSASPPASPVTTSSPTAPRASCSSAETSASSSPSAARTSSPASSRPSPPPAPSAMPPSAPSCSKSSAASAATPPW